MPKINLKYIVTSYISYEAFNLSKPLMALTALTVEDIRSRVIDTGMSATGARFSRYTKVSIRERKLRGLQTNFKDFKRTGTMWNSLKVKLQSPAKATSVFTGRAAHGKVKSKRKMTRTRKAVAGVDEKGRAIMATAEERLEGSSTVSRSITNNKLGRILNNMERVSIMNGRLTELEEHLPLFGDYLTGEVLTAVGLQEQAYQVQKKVRGARTKVKRALKLRRIHGIPSASAYGKKKATRRSRRKFNLRRLLAPKSQLKGERKIYTNTFG